MKQALFMEQGVGTVATVLLLDDSELALDITKEMLTMLNHEALATDNSRDFFNVLEANGQVNIVIVDSIMPEMSGEEVIEKIRQSSDPRLAELPIIMATALDDQAPPAPGVLILNKPFGLDDLKAVVDFALI